MSQIPTKIRELVKTRQNGVCARCGMPGAEMHHRMRRRDAGHPPSMLVWLCSKDHKWAHANPSAAKELGYIISPWEKDPILIPLKSFMGWVRFNDKGDIEFV